MPIPEKAVRIPQPLDPSDVENFTLTISKAGLHPAKFPILDAGEDVADYDLALQAEAIALGVRIKNEAPHFTYISGQLLNFTLYVVPEKRALAVFNKGVEIGLELTVRTDADAWREKQRTVAIMVKQQ